jgi:hypothetical protein
MSHTTVKVDPIPSAMSDAQVAHKERLQITTDNTFVASLSLGRIVLLHTATVY